MIRNKSGLLLIKLAIRNNYFNNRVPIRYPRPSLNYRPVRFYSDLLPVEIPQESIGVADASQDPKIQAALKLKEQLTALSKELTNPEKTPLEAFEHFQLEFPEIAKVPLGRGAFNMASKEYLGSSIEKFLDSTIRELKQPSRNGITTPSVKLVFDFLLANHIISPSVVVKIANYFLSIDKPEQALALYPEYAQYMNKKDRQPAFFVKTVTLVAYLRYCGLNSIDVDEKYIGQLLNVTSWPNYTSVKTVLDQLGIKDNAVLDKCRELRLGSADLSNPDILKKFVSFTQNSQVFYARREWKTIQSVAQAQGTKLSTPIYTAAIAVFAKLNAAHLSIQIWNEMLKEGVKPSTETWNALLLAMSRRGSSATKKNSIKSMLEQMKAQKVKFLPSTYATLIRCYALAQDFENVDKVYKDLVEKDYPLTFDIETSYISALAAFDLKAAYEKLLVLSKSPDFVATIEVVNDLLSAFIKQRDFKQAAAVLDYMTEHALKPDIATYTSILNMMFKQSRKRGLTVKDEAINSLLAEMKQNGIELNPVTYSAMIDGLMKDISSIDAGRKLFEHLKAQTPPNKTIYSSVIGAEMRVGTTENAEILFKEYMSSHKSSAPDIQMFNNLIKGLVNRRQYEKALEYFDMILEKNAKPNLYTYYFLLGPNSKESREPEQVEKVLQALNESDIFYGNKLPKVILDLHELGVKIPEKVLRQLLGA